MNTFRGPFRVMFEDLRLQFYILTSITVVVSIFFILLGIFVTSDGTFHAGSSFGPYYGLFLFYPFLVYTKGFKYIISLGGTRKQFLLSTFANVGIFIVSGTLVLNVLYLLNNYLVQQGISSATLFHMGDLINGSGPFLYFWVDLLWVVFLFGIGFLINSVWQYFGAFRLLIGSTVLVLLVITLITFSDFSGVIKFVILEHFAFVHILAGVGVIAIVLSYFIMKDGPLERGAIAGFTTRKSTAN